MKAISGDTPLSLLCGRSLTGDRRYFPQVEYGGQTVYFCTEYCLRAFLEDPVRFSLAHRKRTTAHPSDHLTTRPPDHPTT